MNEKSELSYKFTDKYEIIDMDNNIILMPIKNNGKAIILNQTSKIILNELQQHKSTITNLISLITSMFIVDREKASKDINAFIDEMIKLSVITVTS